MDNGPVHRVNPAGQPQAVRQLPTSPRSSLFKIIFYQKLTEWIAFCGDNRWFNNLKNSNILYCTIHIYSRVICRLYQYPVWVSKIGVSRQHQGFILYCVTRHLVILALSLIEKDHVGIG